MREGKRPALMDALELLDLEPLEAETYATLHDTGGATASELAQALRVDRTKAYRTARSLIQAGLAMEMLERPARFVALDISGALHRLEVDAARSISRLHNIRMRFKAELEPVVRTGRQLDLVMGRQSAYEAAGRLIRSAEESIEYMDTHAHAAKDIDTAGMPSLLGKKVDEGVHVRSIVSSSPADMPGVCRVCKTSDQGMRWLVADGTSALAFIEIDEHRTFRRAADRALVTDAASLIEPLSFTFSALWDAQPLYLNVAGTMAARPEHGAAVPPQAPAVGRGHSS